jgi:hypothetical protein
MADVYGLLAVFESDELEIDVSDSEDEDEAAPADPEAIDRIIKDLVKCLDLFELYANNGDESETAPKTEIAQRVSEYIFRARIPFLVKI